MSDERLEALDSMLAREALELWEGVREDLARGDLHGVEQWVGNDRALSPISEALEAMVEVCEDRRALSEPTAEAVAATRTWLEESLEGISEHREAHIIFHREEIESVLRRLYCRPEPDSEREVKNISSVVAAASKYRKKPVVVRAFRWNGAQDWPLLDAWISELGYDEMSGPGIWQDGNWLKIDTLEGVLTASPGDWLIRGVQGEFYPCKPDIFQQTYEPAPDTE